MRILLLAASLLAVLPSIAQDASLYIVPRWKVGDSRSLDIVQTVHDVKEGVPTDEQTTQHATVRVVNEDAKAFILRVQCENAFVNAMRELGAHAGSEMDPFRQVQLRYSVSKLDGRTRLENWEEVQKFMRRSFDVVMTSLKQQDTTAAAAAGLSMLPILDVFKDQQHVEDYFSEIIGYVTFPFGKRIADRDTLKSTAYCGNPFNPTGNDSIPITSFTSIKQVDRLAQQAVLRREERSDFTAFVSLMKQMMRRSMDEAKMSPTERKKTEARMEAELKNMRFDMQNEVLYTVDLQSTWPIKVEATVHMTATNGSRSEVTTSTTVVTVSK